MATIKSDQHRANELANDMKFNVEVKNNPNAMEFTNISSARRLEPIQGDLAKASTLLKNAVNKLSNGVKGVAASIAETDKNAAKQFK